MNLRTVVVMTAAAAAVFVAPSLSSGVVGGQPISITQAPWTVEVVAGHHYACTGVIVSPTRVLTAGHCLWSLFTGDRLTPRTFAVEAGVSNF